MLIDIAITLFCFEISPRCISFGLTNTPIKNARPLPLAGFVPGAGKRHAMSSFEQARRKLSKCLWVYVADTGRCGLGIFAAKPFQAGAIVMRDEDGDYYRNVLSYQQLRGSGYSLDITLQVGLDAFKLPNGSLDDFTNHSCDPNTGIRLTDRGTIVMALRDIAAHEELTYDYSTYLNNCYESMHCLCGAATCRGAVGNFDTLPAALRRRYLALGIVGDFVDGPALTADVAD